MAMQGPIIWWNFHGDGTRVIADRREAPIRVTTRSYETLYLGDDSGFVHRMDRSFGSQIASSCRVSHQPIVRLCPGYEGVFARDIEGVLSFSTTRDKKLMYREKWNDPALEIAYLQGSKALAVSHAGVVKLIPTSVLVQRGVALE